MIRKSSRKRRVLVLEIKIPMVELNNMLRLSIKISEKHHISPTIRFGDQRKEVSCYLIF